MVIGEWSPCPSLNPWTFYHHTFLSSTFYLLSHWRKRVRVAVWYLATYLPGLSHNKWLCAYHKYSFLFVKNFHRLTLLELISCILSANYRLLQDLRLTSSNEEDTISQIILLKLLIGKYIQHWLLLFFFLFFFFLSNNVSFPDCNSTHTV